MTGFDHSQSPRLGQRVPYEGTTVRMFTGTELPEVSVDGQLIFRTDIGILQVYNDAEDAWQDVGAGEIGSLTYVGPTKPTTPPGKEGDSWYDTANGHRLSVHDGDDFQVILLGADAIDPADLPVLYTWVKYADNATGTGFTDDPTGKAYMGVAVNQTTATESSNYLDYQWSLIKGADGSAGRGIASTLIEYKVNTSGTTPPTGTWSSTPVATTTAGEFLWSRTIITYTSGAPATTTTYTSSAHGAQGNVGSQGNAGVSVTAVTPYWARITAGTGPPANPTGTTPSAPWQNTEPAYATNTELWTSEKITYSSGSPTWTTVVKSSSYTASTAAYALADGKMTIFRAPAYGATLPSVVQPEDLINGGPIDYQAEGDLWFREDEGNKAYTWNSTTDLWVEAPTGLQALADTVTTPGTLPDNLTDANLTETTITGAVIQTTSAENQGIKLDSDGLRAYPPEGGSPFLDVKPAEGLVIVAGEGTFDKLVTPDTGAAELGGATQIKSGGSLLLSSGAQPPGTPPKLGTTYTTQQFTDDGLWANRHGLIYDGSTYYYTTRNTTTTKFVLERWTNAGTLSFTSAPEVGGYQAYDLCFGGSGEIFILSEYTNGEFSQWSIEVFDIAGMGFMYYNPFVGTQIEGSKTPAIGKDPGVTSGFVLAQARTNNLVRFRKFTLIGGVLTQGTSVDQDVSYDVNLSGVYMGQGDFAANRYIIASPSSGPFKTYTQGSPAAYQASEEWESGMPNKVGWDYWGGAWHSIDRTGLMRTYTDLEKNTVPGHADMTKWVSTSYFREKGATDWETFQSPKAFLPIKKRTKLTVTGAGLPPTPGTNDPNQIQIYVGKGTTEPARTAMWQQTAPAVGVITKEYSSLATSGTNPVDPTVLPSPNAFPDATSAYMHGGTKRADGNPKMKIAGTGVANIDGLLPPGSMMMWPTATAPTGWVLCDGAGLNTALYPDLFAALQYTYGGSGTTFNVPNMTGRFPLGAGVTQPSGTNRALGSASGVDEKTINASHLPPHTHGAGTLGTPTTHSATGSGSRLARGTSSADSNFAGFIGDTGVGNGLTNSLFAIMPPYQAINFIIKT